jgi:NTP pyrophosphatase (non-canonical NTP hydrolase)
LKYAFNEDGKTIIVSREEIEFLVTKNDMTEEEKERAVFDYLNEVNASVYSDITFNEYQDFTKQTAIYPQSRALEYLCLGLASEAGEVAGKLKKIIRDEDGQVSPTTRSQMVKEIGDVLWYCARFVDELGGSLSEVAELNMDKLISRKNREVLGGSGDDR